MKKIEGKGQKNNPKLDEEHAQFNIHEHEFIPVTVVVVGLCIRKCYSSEDKKETNEAKKH